MTHVQEAIFNSYVIIFDKEAVLAIARKKRIPETPQEINNDPMRLKFLGLEKQPHYDENDLEQAIIL